VFELSPPATADGAWSETVLYSFAGYNDGAFLGAGLIFDGKGNLYGTTRNGGESGNAQSSRARRRPFQLLNCAGVAPRRPIHDQHPRREP
jgi:hypothetical protein